MKFRWTAAILASFLLTGCVTSIKVKKVDPAERSSVEGRRYSLPATYLAVTPNAKNRGGYSVEPTFLPDHCETYAIAAKTYLGSLTFDSTVTNGLLTKVVIKQDTSAVAAEAIKAAGEVAKAKLDANKAEEEAAEKKAKEAKEKLEMLQDEVAAAEKALRAAEIKLERWTELVKQEPENPVYQTNKIAAEVEKAQAEADLKQADAKLDTFLASPQAAVAAALDAFDALQPKSSTGPNDSEVKKVHGPVYYRLIDTCDPLAELDTLKDCEVKLVPVDWGCKPGDKCPAISDKTFEQQRSFPVTAAPPANVPDPKEPELAEQFTGPIPIDPAVGVFKRTLELTSKYCNVLGAVLRKDPTSGIGDKVMPNPVTVSGGADKRSFEISLHKGALAAGPYALAVDLHWGNCSNPRPATLGIKLRMP